VEAYTPLAFVNTFYDWNWAEAKKNFEKVFAINPNYYPAFYWHSFYLAWVESKFEEAIQLGLKVVELEPLLPTSHSIVWAAYLGAGKSEASLQAVQEALELDPNSFLLYYLLGMSLAVLGRYNEAIEALQYAITKIIRHPWLVSELCWVYSLAGDVEAAKLLKEELVTRSKTEYISGIYLFIAAHSSQNYDQAFEYLEMAFEQRASLLVASRIWPTLEAMRIDDRFHAIIKKMNFPPA
jgi:tetratricopeptide (TPR) repeat protein